jgi:predicted double-glycine peptidase/ElaB/YqjD/DUF883 family membrane-anchored ribosome-binding protein
MVFWASVRYRPFIFLEVFDFTGSFLIVLEVFHHFFHSMTSFSMKRSMVTPLIGLIVLSTISPTMMFALSGEVDSGVLISTGNSVTNSDIISVDTGSTATGTVDEDEEDEASLDLWDDQLDLDATKDFTAIVRQSKEYTCGPAALATLMTQLGNNTSEEEILPQLQDLNPEKWVSLYDLKQATQKLEQHVYIKKWNTETILAYIERTSDPVLIHDEKKWVGWHFSVIKSYNAEKWLIELSDTEAGNIKYSIEDFRHIYTGDALVISDDIQDEILNNQETNISDADALLIWGKYVPVVLYAQKNGYTSSVNDFRACQNNALALSTAAKRNAARRICYESLSSTLGSAMSNSTELGFMTSYNVSTINPLSKENVTDSEFWLNAITKILTDKLQANKNLIASKQSTYNTKTNQYTIAIADSTAIKWKINSYNAAMASKTLLEGTLSTKRGTQTALSNEINGGVFTQGAQIFSLGAVGNQLTAQSSSYTRLSASLAWRLSNIDGQVRQIQTQQRNAQANYDTYNIQYNSYISSYNSYSNTATRYFLSYRSSAFNRQSNLNNYNYYNSLAISAQNSANNALLNRNYWQTNISNLAGQIASLQYQKTVAQVEVNNAAVETARLETLKKFGDTELQRKRILLISINNEITNLSRQLTVAATNSSAISVEISALRANIVTANSAIKREIDILKSEIDTLSAEIAAQQSEIANEANNEKSWDDSAEIGATQDLRYAPANAINDANAYIRQNPWQAAKIGGVAILVAGGTVICVATAPVCATAMWYVGTVSGGYFVVDGVKVITTWSNIFGTPVSDSEWGTAVLLLPVDILTLGLSGQALRAWLVAKYGTQWAENIWATLVRGWQAEKAMAVEAIKAADVWMRPVPGWITVNGIFYTEHVMARMAPEGYRYIASNGELLIWRWIPPSVVQNALKNGVKVIGRELGTIELTYDNIFLVVSADLKKIITVMKR